MGQAREKLHRQSQAAGEGAVKLILLQYIHRHVRFKSALSYNTGLIAKTGYVEQGYEVYHFE